MHKHGHPNQQTRPHVVVTNPVHAHHHQHPINGGVPPYYPTQQNPNYNPNFFFQPVPQHTHVHNPHNQHNHNHNHGHTGGPTHGHGY